MLIFLILIAIIAISVVLNKLIYKHEITLLEMLANLTIPILILGIFWLISISSKLHDTQIYNGHVIEKQRNKISCRHSYSCNCRQSCSGSGKNKVCSQVCQTCYSHLYDFEYVAKTTIGNFYIDTIDRQGIQIPQRYKDIIIDEPVSDTRSYQNYIKGSQNSLFNIKVEVSPEDQKRIPKYPNKIYDYYRLDRVLDISGYLSKDLIKDHNLKISEILKDQKSEKKSNVVIVYLKDSEDFANKIISQWIGGKKNDILIFIGIDKELNIQYVKIHSWSLQNIFDVLLRDDIYRLKNIGNPELFNIIQQEIDKSYVRRSFEEFEYLRWQILPSTIEVIIYCITCLICSFTIGHFLSKNEIKYY